MKRLFSILAASAVLAVSIASAQTRPSLIAEIPFSFRVGKTLMPAGTYEVKEGVTRSAVLVKGKGSGPMALVLTTAREKTPAPVGQLVFHRYGNNYFLSSVWKPGIREGFELATSPAEREMARTNQTHALASVRAVLK